MIPRITINRTANREKHVHSLFGLKVSEFTKDGSGVSLDDSPFIVDDYQPADDEVGEGWPLGLNPTTSSVPSFNTVSSSSSSSTFPYSSSYASPTTTTLAPFQSWGNGHAVREQTPTHYTRILDGETESGRGGSLIIPTLPDDGDENPLRSSTATKLPDISRKIGIFGGKEDTFQDAEKTYTDHYFERRGDKDDVRTKFGINFAVDSSSKDGAQWLFETADKAGRVLIEAHSNVTNWDNSTSWNVDNGESFLALNGTCTNYSLNGSQCAIDRAAPLVMTPESLSLCLFLLFFAVSTIFGNGLVIVAVARERYLHTVTNYFIMSLAVADCLVGALVMPFSALYVSFDYWPFGPDFCDVWRSFDVLASTASILNLCVISLDRYWAITDPFSYPSRMSPRRACMLIALVWVCSALISFPAIAWWRAVSDPHPPGKCPFTEDLSYLVFSSTISFYGPLFVMVFTYFRIYRAATEQTRSLKLGQKLVSTMGDGEMELTLRIHRGGGGGGCGGGSGGASSNGNGMPRAHYPAGKTHSYTQENGGLGDPHSLSSPLDDGESCPLGPMHEGASPDSSTKVVARNLKNFSISRKLCKFAKEKKAAKTLGIVMGVFIVCWLPFFVTNLLSGLCGEKCIREPELVGDIVTWLGWINSAMNPVIYACWAKDFRR